MSGPLWPERQRVTTDHCQTLQDIARRSSVNLSICVCECVYVEASNHPPLES